MHGVDVTVVSFARQAGGVARRVGVRQRGVTRTQVDALVGAADAAARAAGPAEDANDLVGGAADADWDDAPGETGIDVFDDVRPGPGRGVRPRPVRRAGSSTASSTTT